MYIEFTQWTPDFSSTETGEITNLVNMIPSLKGYKGAPTPVDVGASALGGTCYGAELLIKHDGEDVLFGGTATKIYKKNSIAWDDVTRASGDYSLMAGEQWCFTQQGNITLAVSRAEYTQKFNHTTPDSAFSDLTAMPLTAIAEAVGQFVLIGDYINPSGSVDTPDGWACSAIGDYTNWTASVDDQCVYGRLLDTPGRITGVKRLADYAIYYKQRSMYLARYTGIPDAWTFSLVSDVIGAENNDCIVRVGTTHYFLSHDNFYSFNSATVTPIGDPIKKWFYENSNSAYRSKVKGVHDIANEIVFWFFPDKTSDVNDRFVAYNYRTNKWGYGWMETPVDEVVEYRTGNATYGDMLTLYPLYSDIVNSTKNYVNLMPPKGTPYAAVIDTSKKLKTLNGKTGVSVIGTNDYGNETNVLLARKLRPRFTITPESAILAIATRDTLGGTLEQRTPFVGGGDTVDISDNNSFDMMVAARWHRASMQFSGDVEIVGFDVDFKGTGKE